MVGGGAKIRTCRVGESYRQVASRIGRMPVQAGDGRSGTLLVGRRRLQRDANGTMGSQAEDQLKGGVGK